MWGTRCDQQLADSFTFGEQDIFFQRSDFYIKVWFLMLSVCKCHPILRQSSLFLPPLFLRPPLLLHLEGVLEVLLSPLLPLPEYLHPASAHFSSTSASTAAPARRLTSFLKGLLDVDMLWYLDVPVREGTLKIDWKKRKRPTYRTSLFWTKNESNLDLWPRASVKRTSSMEMFMKPSEWTIWAILTFSLCAFKL